MKRKLTAGQTSVSLPIFIQDTASTTGGGLSGLTSGTSGLVAEYRRRGASAWTTITLTSKTLGTWASGGFVADGALGGAYELDLPDAVCASGARWVAIRAYGAANMLPCLIEIELDAFDYTLATQPVNMTQIGGDTQSATDLKDFADAGYDPTTNKLTGAVELDSAARVKLDASQPDYAPATATALAAAKTILDKVDTGLVVDGAVYQFTANMLELAPAGGGGGGSGDATLAKQEEILTQLDVIQTKTDQIGSVGAITSLLAAAVLEPGTITSFPETLTIGDSYTDQNGRSIQIPIVDTDGNPISSTGSLNFADASVTFTLQRSGETDSTRVITGTASFVDPPGTGTGAGAPYAVVEISSTETAKGLKKYKYSGILTFTWSGTGTDVMSFETSTVTFDN